MRIKPITWFIILAVVGVALWRFGAFDAIVNLLNRPQGPAASTQAPEQPVVDNQGVQPANTAADPAEGMPKVVVGMDAFGPYYTAVLAKAMGLDAKYGIDMELIPFYSSDETSFDEAARTAALTSGEWDVLFTTVDKLALHPDMGQLVGFIDETDGADKLICNSSVSSLNDLKGKRISFLSESIGEFAVYYYLKLVRISPVDVALIPNFDGVATYDDNGGVNGGAVYEFIQGKVDCVSGWEPDVDAALDAGGHVVTDTHTIRVALDVILASNNANTNRSGELQAFMSAYFEAMKAHLENPDQAEQDLYNYLAASGLDGDNWSFIYGAGDWVGWLETTPQATLADNAFVFRNANAIADRLSDACRTWKAANFPTGDCSPGNYTSVINGNYVQSATGNSTLATNANPVNDTFVFASQVNIPQLTEEELQSAEVLATLPFEKIPFLPNDENLTGEAKALLDENVCPVLQASPGLVLKLTGSAALPAGDQYTLEGSLDFARQRAQSVFDYLTVYCKIDTDRIYIDVVEPAHQESLDNALLEQDRFVRFELVTTGY